MKFKSIANPEPSLGSNTQAPKIVVPNMALSLADIIERFTRGEPQWIGKEAVYMESDEDLEKIKNADLVDRAEYVDKLKRRQELYNAQEKRRAQATAAHIEKLAIEKRAAEIAEEEKAKPVKKAKTT